MSNLVHPAAQKTMELPKRYINRKEFIKSPEEKLLLKAMKKQINIGFVEKFGGKRRARNQAFVVKLIKTT